MFWKLSLKLDKLGSGFRFPSKILGSSKKLSITQPHLDGWDQSFSM
jgi:hypothetical protein